MANDAVAACAGQCSAVLRAILGASLRRQLTALDDICQTLPPGPLFAMLTAARCPGGQEAAARLPPSPADQC